MIDLKEFYFQNVKESEYHYRFLDSVKKVNYKVIAICNQKGGVGKTTTAANLSAALSENECIERAEQFLYKMEQKVNGINFDATIPELLYEKIESDFRKNYTGEQGYERNVRTIGTIEKSAIGHMPITDIRIYHIERYLQSLTRYSNNTISKFYSMIKLAFAVAVDRGIVRSNLMENRNVKCPISDRPDKKVRGLTEEEQMKFIKALGEYKPQKRKLEFIYGGVTVYESYTRQSLPTKEYRELLGSALCVFSSNNGFIIENIIKTNDSFDWYELIDKEFGLLRRTISETISNKCGNTEIEDLFFEVVNMRNRIIHGFRITSKSGEQVLATKTRKKDGNDQFEITNEYLMDFIKKNDKLSDLLHRYRGY